MGADDGVDQSCGLTTRHATPIFFRPERPFLSAQAAGLGAKTGNSGSALKGPFIVTDGDSGFEWPLQGQH
jgi:hypothetical protein